jgi:integrase
VGSVRHEILIQLTVGLGRRHHPPTLEQHPPPNKPYDLNIPNALLYMKREAYADSTIKEVARRLKHLKKHSDLSNPEAVKTFIANKQCTNGYKESLIEAYAHLMRSANIEWKQPFYKRYDKLPKIPQTEQLNLIIANSRQRMALFLSMMRDIGTRPVELTWLKVRDIDLKNGVVSITGAKHTIGRTLKLKAKTLEMVKQYIVDQNIGQNKRLFPISSDRISEHYRRIRNRLAKKLQEPTIRQIRLYDFRHHYASMLYHKTKDLLLVKQQLGHKDLRTTLRYTQLLNLQDDEWTCRTATSDKEATALIEANFEYVTTTPSDLMLFRKRK